MLRGNSDAATAAAAALAEMASRIAKPDRPRTISGDARRHKRTTAADAAKGGSTSCRYQRHISCGTILRCMIGMPSTRYDEFSTSHTAAAPVPPYFCPAIQIAGTTKHTAATFIQKA